MLSKGLGGQLRHGWRVVCLSIALGLAPLLLALSYLAGRAEAGAAGSICSPGTTVVTYTSSVDGAVLETLELLPAVYTPSVPFPLVVLLPGVGGSHCNYSSAAWEAAADSYGMVLMTVRPRELAGYPGARSTFYLDGALAPGEQDVLDALAMMAARRAINPMRIYLAGYSMGGVGTLGLASRHPGLFAAAAPGAVISDLFQESAYTSTQPNPGFPILLGGAPGAGVVTDTHWYQNSPRFLLANLMHTPLFVVHGLSDTLIPNATATWPYMQARHVVDTPGYGDSRGTAQTLQQLGTAWPGSFLETHLWPSAEHGPAQASWTPEAVLTFFDGRVLITQPLTAALTTYDDQLTRAYWVGVDLTAPWTATPATAFVVRSPLLNSAQAWVTGSLTLTLDLPGMALTNTIPLTVSVGPAGSGPAGDVAVVLSGTWTAAGGYAVIRDSAVLTTTAYTVSPAALRLLRQTNVTTATYVIRVAVLPYKVYVPEVRR